MDERFGIGAGRFIADELLTLRPKIDSDDGKLTLQKEMVEMSVKKDCSPCGRSSGSEIYDEVGRKAGDPQLNQ
jgi:hypothetical protein